MDTPVSRSQGKPQFTDVQTLRERARKHVMEGAVTDSYGADREQVIDLLQAALATEIVCVLRYRQNYFAARGLRAKIAAAEFLEHSKQEQEHADQIAERIVQLGGDPDLDPATLERRSHAEYRIGATLAEMIRENLVAERIAIESYREIAEYVGKDDPTTRRLMEAILAVEEEHAEDLADLLVDCAGTSGAAGASCPA
jgi:bacterioferritin